MIIAIEDKYIFMDDRYIDQLLLNFKMLGAWSQTLQQKQLKVNVGHV